MKEVPPENLVCCYGGVSSSSPVEPDVWQDTQLVSMVTLSLYERMFSTKWFAFVDQTRWTFSLAELTTRTSGGQAGNMEGEDAHVDRRGQGSSLAGRPDGLYRKLGQEVGGARG